MNTVISKCHCGSLNADYKLFFDKDFNPKAHGNDLDLTPWKVKFS